MNATTAQVSLRLLFSSRSRPAIVNRARAGLLLGCVLLAASATSPAAEIHDAAQAGDVARIKALLTADPGSANAKDADGWTPLLHAVSGDSAAAVAALLDAGADVRAATSEGGTALHNASSPAVAELLLARQADVRAVDRLGATPLHDAAAAGRKEVAEVLLAHGAEVDARNQGSWTPLHVAVTQQEPAVIELLLTHRANIQAQDKDGLTALRLAEKTGDVDLVALLARHGATPSDGEDIARIMTLTRFAKASALVRKAPVAKVTAFLDANPDLVRTAGRDGRTLLHYAASTVYSPDPAALIGYLLDHGAEVNSRNDAGGTPLNGAAPFSCLAAARVLLARGADVNVRSKDGETPLHGAAIAAHATEMAELLLAKGADINARDNKGETPLHRSTSNVVPDSTITEFLISKGADMSIRNNRGETPLTVALTSMFGMPNENAVKALRAHGAPE